MLGSCPLAGAADIEVGDGASWGAWVSHGDPKTQDSGAEPLAEAPGGAGTLAAIRHCPAPCRHAVPITAAMLTLAGAALLSRHPSLHTASKLGEWLTAANTPHRLSEEASAPRRSAGSEETVLEEGPAQPIPVWAARVTQAH